MGVSHNDVNDQNIRKWVPKRIIIITRNFYLNIVHDSKAFLGLIIENCQYMHSYEFY